MGRYTESYFCVLVCPTVSYSCNVPVADDAGLVTFWCNAVAACTWAVGDFYLRFTVPHVD
jgi:hypothetical protein